MLQYVLSEGNKPKCLEGCSSDELCFMEGKQVVWVWFFFFGHLISGFQQFDYDVPTGDLLSILDLCGFLFFQQIL